MASGDDDVPPLEDCSEMIEKAENLRVSSTKENPSPSTSMENKKSSRESTNPPASVNGAGASAGNVANPKKKTEFGGMKKGFLFGGSKPAKKTPNNSTSPKKQGDDLPFITPKQTKEESLRIGEVQESLKESLGFKQGWMTEELITKMVENQKLSKWLADPRSNRVLEEFQRNPEAAMKKYKDNAEICQFFRDFGHLMSDHFSQLAQEEEAKKTREAAASQGADIKTEAEAEAERALQNPQVREALMNEDVQRAIQAIKENPDNGERILDRADAQLRHHLTVLLKAGVLGLQQV